ncbi:MAG TPA: DMT family transporter, partial [Burkholderiales bacterium]|nr:DMT family transporter [Burkholderiales bacterium]
MRPADYGRLVALAAIWGASFIFTRVVAPSLGAIWTAESRVLLGGLALLAWFRFAGFDAGLRRHWRYYLAVGAVNSAIPFALYAYAAIHLPASLLSIVNATSPMFGMLFGALSGTERVTRRKLAGLALGAAGVALVAQPEGLQAGAAFYAPIAAALGACAGYGLTGVLVRRWGRGVPARGVAAGQQLAAAAVLAPLLVLVPLPAPPTALVVGNVLAVALLASAVAFLIYFRLIADVGATRALTVTFLIPAFGVL